MVELLGAFFLTFVAMASMLGNENSLITVGVALVGLTLMALVFIFGKVSGGHFNPAISVGAWSVGKLDTKDLPFYVVLQIGGALLAKLAIGFFGEVNLPTASMTKPINVLLAEAAGALIFSLGVASVAMAKEKLSSSSPFFIGLSLMLGLSLATILGSVGVLNPAISVGLNILAWPYLVGSVVGSLIGFNLYKYLVA